MKKTYEVGVPSGVVHEADVQLARVGFPRNTWWTGQCVEAENETEAENIATSLGYRSATVREYRPPQP